MALELTPDMNITRTAKDLGMYVTTFWRLAVAPAMAAMPVDTYGNQHPTVLALKKRAFMEIAGIIPHETEGRWFRAFMADPLCHKFLSSRALKEFGVSRAYAVRRMLTLLEREMARTPNRRIMPQLLAHLVPALGQANLEYLIKTKEYPITLGPFERASEHAIEMLSKQGKRDAVMARAAMPKRWGASNETYLADLEARRATQFAAHADLLNATPTPRLKAFAKHLQTTLPSKASKRMPHPGAVIQYIDRCLRSRIPATVYQELHAQATAYAVEAPIAIQQRLNSLV